MIQEMGRRNRRELMNRLTVLVSHLLKWQAQPARRSASWSATIREQRRQIDRRLDDFPSLRPVLDEVLDRIYSAAREDAAKETGIPERQFPRNCPFTPDEVLSSSFPPE